MIFKGSGVAIVTPMDKNYNIDFEKLNELIEFHIENSTDALIVCGTTGESSTLTYEEKMEVIKYSVTVANKRIPVIAGSGSNNTHSSCELSKYAEQVGADGLLVVTPYYNKCTQKGLFLHYKEIANSVTIPIIVYNVPSRTNVNIEIDTLIKLSTISNICGIKEASGNISQISNMISKLPRDFAVYSGNDDQTLPILALGGDGVISVIANILPDKMHNLCNTFFKGDLESARSIHYKYLDLMKSLFIEVNPIPIKEAMNLIGIEVGPCRLPLSGILPKNNDILKKSLHKVNL
ncbi:MAG: 4-hydroxy-tetrahydrodipicolinate synthase [Clostridia bacterium]